MDEGWCGEGVLQEAVKGIMSGQVTSCQRLLDVVGGRLVALQRWDTK
ncbi:unnamed protein product [Choristocarpus tenellus]